MTATAGRHAGEKVALVLGAGGARGWAQIGVIEALEARGLDIIAVAGSSSGALVGGIYAAGKLSTFREQLVRMQRRHFLRLLDPVLGRAGLFNGDRLVHSMRELVGDPLIETLPIQFTAVAVDLQRWPQEPPGEPAQTNGNGHSHESLGERVGDWFEHTLGGGDASADGDA